MINVPFDDNDYHNKDDDDDDHNNDDDDHINGDDDDHNNDDDDDEEGSPCATRKLWAAHPASQPTKHPGQALFSKWLSLFVCLVLFV